MNDLTHLAIMF